jgi:hypothetical protein
MIRLAGSASAGFVQWFVHQQHVAGGPNTFVLVAKKALDFFAGTLHVIQKAYTNSHFEKQKKSRHGAGIKKLGIAWWLLQEFNTGGQYILAGDWIRC